MILWRFGPKRLSPSLVVWQVRHALLNISCPDSVSVPLPAGSWGTAGKPRSTRNVVQTNPEIAVRGISAPGDRLEADSCTAANNMHGLHRFPHQSRRRARVDASFRIARGQPPKLMA